MRAPGRAPLLPQGRRQVEPEEGPAPRQDQARQLQRLARRARRRLRLLRLRRHRPRAAAQLPGADARLLPRPGRRLRHRPAGLRQLRQPDHQGRRVAAVPLPRADPARRQPLRRADVRGHLQRGAHPGAQADRRPVRLDHRGHGDRLRDAPPQESGHRPQVALGLHPGRARGRRGPQRLDGLLHPADALVAGDVRDDPQAVLEGLVLAAAEQALQLHDDDHLLSDVGPELDPGGAELLPVPGPGRVRRQHRPGGLADALRQRLRAPDRPVRLEPPPQRLPARAGGLRRRGRHDHVRAVGAAVRQGAHRLRAAPQEQVRGDPEGRLGQPGHPVRHLPLPLVLHRDLRWLDRRRLRLRPLAPRDDHLGDVRAADHRVADVRLAPRAEEGEEATAGRGGGARTAGPAAAGAVRTAHAAAQARLGRPRRRGDDQTMQIALGGLGGRKE